MAGTVGIEFNLSTRSRISSRSVGVMGDLVVSLPTIGSGRPQHEPKLEGRKQKAEGGKQRQ